MAVWSGKRNEGRPREALRATVRGVLLLIGLSAVALGFARFVDRYDEAGAYLSAPLCTTAAVDGDCLRQETGRVTHKWVDVGGEGAGTSYRVEVTRESGPTTVHDLTEPFYNDVQPETHVDLQIWKGEVVRLSHDGHQHEDPHVSWTSMIPHSLLIGLGSVAITYGLLGLRREWSGMPALWGGMVVLGSIIGSAVLADLHWSFPTTLALAVTAWLLMAGVSMSLVPELARGNQPPSPAPAPTPAPQNA